MSRAALRCAPALLTLLVACAQGSAPKVDEAQVASTQTSVTEERAGAILGHVQTRDRKLTIRAAEDGPRFTVASLDGAILATDLSERELLDHDRELFDLVKTSRAFLDASVTIPETKPAAFHGGRDERPRMLGDL